MAPRVIDSREDRSTIIEVTTYALAGAFILFFIARQVMKAIVFRKVAFDDLFILLATVSSNRTQLITTNYGRHSQLAYQLPH